MYYKFKVLISFFFFLQFIFRYCYINKWYPDFINKRKISISKSDVHIIRYKAKH